VAENFSVLAGLFPGRIDLGIGRAAGTDPMTTFALQRDRRQAAPDDFPEQLAELLALLEDRMPPDHPFHRLTALPGLPEAPVPWLLGSSMQSAIWAAEQGLPYAFADFINPRGAQHAELYRESFQPSHRLATPKVAVAAWAIAADSAEEAERLATSARMTFTLLRRGQLIRVPPIEKAQRFLAEEQRLGRPAPARRSILGTGESVREELVQVARDSGAEEVVVVTITHDHGARRRSYELLADAFGLRASSPESRAAA
jgi:luciferase family oxidoreductase group 1